MLLGDGAGGFGAQTTFPAGASPFSVAVGDFNGDSDLDLVTANQVSACSNNVSVLLGDGAGGFGTQTTFGAGSTPFSVAVGDFNGDGKRDLVTANITSNNVSVLLNTTKQCSDGLDNDSDGKVDFPDDQGCSSADDDSEAPDPPQCSDRLDNDSDGQTNFPDDQGCSSAQDDSEAPAAPQCSDGLDNDSDGKRTSPTTRAARVHQTTRSPRTPRLRRPTSSALTARTTTATARSTGPTGLLGSNDDSEAGSGTSPAPQCTIRGTSGNDIIRGTSGDDVICAGDGNDIVYGGGGDDIIHGEGGNDILRGEGGNDLSPPRLFPRRRWQRPGDRRGGNDRRLPEARAATSSRARMAPTRSTPAMTFEATTWQTAGRGGLLRD